MNESLQFMCHWLVKILSFGGQQTPADHRESVAGLVAYVIKTAHGRQMTVDGLSFLPSVQQSVTLNE